jgi:hypothetical protein
LGTQIRGRSDPSSRPIMPRYPLGSSENRGRHDCNHASSTSPGPRPFSWGGASIPMVMTVRLAPRHWLRLGMDHVDGVSTLFGIKRIITGQWVRLDKPFRGRSGPFSRPIMPRYPLGSFGATPLASFGKTASQTQLASFGDGPCRRGIDTFRDSTHQNWYWLRLGKRIRGRSRPFSRPIMPRYPLGSFGATPLASFGKTVVGLVRGGRNWLRSGSPGCGRDWLRSGKRRARSGARRRSVRIVKERRRRRPQLHHRGPS